MKKIPTLFVRIFDDHKVVSIANRVTPGYEWVLNGEGIPTVKIDGACCSIINGIFYKRYDAKHGKVAPAGAIPCCEPDPITGHHPHWVAVNPNNASDKWFVEAYNASGGKALKDGTYEAIGKHFRSNSYHLENDILVPHGKEIITEPVRSFDQIKDYLESNYVEGIVYWKDGAPQCKIKRTDFGFEWK